MDRESIILIVDDEPLMRETLEALLTNEGYQLEFAADGREALDKALELMPDLILLDVMMPEMDGYEVCRRLRRDPLLEKVPVVMVTALDDRDSRLRGIEAGADDFISKPYDRVELRSRVRTITRLNRYLSLVLEKSRFEWIVERAPNGLLVVDATATIKLANPALLKMVGSKIGEKIINQTLARVVVKDQLEECLSSLESVMAETQALAGGELTFKRLDGSTFPVDIEIGFFPWEEESGALLVVRDITERKAMEQRLLQSEKLAAVGQLASGVAHELNTPLFNITLAAEKLQKLSSDPEISKVADKILSQADMASYIVKDLLEYARPASPDLKILNLNEIIKASLEEVPLPEWVEVQQELDLDLPSLKGDRVQLKQVVSNLLLNGVDAMEDRKQGTLTITTKKTPQGVEFWITDTGRGVLSEDQSRLFEPFFTTKPAGKGTGLGLSIVKRLVEAHGGTIFVYSTEKEGTTFSVNLPAKGLEESSGGGGNQLIGGGS